MGSKTGRARTTRSKCSGVVVSGSASALSNCSVLNASSQADSASTWPTDLEELSSSRMARLLVLSAGGRLGACFLLQAPQGGLHSVSDARRQRFGPGAHRLGCDPNGFGGPDDGAPKQFDGSSFVHEPTLKHAFKHSRNHGCH